MDHGFVSAPVLRRLVLDPFCSVPIFISVMRHVAPQRCTFPLAVPLLPGPSILAGMKRYFFEPA
jgi:small neutral amino acid transporter SnatA (MarC family)